MNLAYVATAAALGGGIGSTLALTGAGGGILAVPLLVFALGLTVAQAAPVGLMAVGMAASLGAALGLREGIVRYRAALLMGAVGMCLAPVGVDLAHRVPAGPLTIAFAVVLALSSIATYRRTLLTTANCPRLPAPCIPDPTTGRLVWTRPCAFCLAMTGAAAGMSSGLLGVGGGFVIVPSLARYTNLSGTSIVTTSLSVIALVSAAGVGTAALHGLVDWSIAIPFAVGASAALLAARRYAVRWSTDASLRGFAVLSFMTALLLLRRGIHLVLG